MVDRGGGGEEIQLDVQDVSLVPRPLPAFHCCNIEKLGVAWGRGYKYVIIVVVIC